MKTYRKVFTKDRIPDKEGFYDTDKGLTPFYPDAPKNVKHWESGITIKYFYEEI